MRAGAVIGLLASALTLSACGASSDVSPTADQAHAHRPLPEHERVDRTADRVEPVRCPGESAGCEAASGTVLYVERVDPDGDGDAHFVLLSEQGITAPGITVVDVRADLRPRPLPGPGDLLSAAGPVANGTYGQRQIEAVALNVARPH